MIKSISFVALTHFFHFNQLKILRQPGYLIFFKLNQQYFLQCTVDNQDAGESDSMRFEGNDSTAVFTSNSVTVVDVCCDPNPTLPLPLQQHTVKEVKKKHNQLGCLIIST